MTYVHNGSIVDPDTPDGQARIAKVHADKERLLCACRQPHPEMYIALNMGKFQIKRMPDTGGYHAPDCGSYEPPEELSGLGQVQGSAIEVDVDSGNTMLKLDFPLSIRGAAPPPMQGEGDGATEVQETPRKLTLTAMLHYLWHEADLVKWVPAMEGKRWWGPVRNALLNSTAGKHAKKSPLADKLFVPEPFKKEAHGAASAKRRAFFSTLSDSKKSGTPLGILVAEYKSHAPTRMGARFMFKHLPDCGFFASEEFLKQFEKVFEDKLILADMIEGGHAMVIATFKVEKAGYPVLHELGMMVTDANWLPVEHLREVDLVRQAITDGRRFTKSLRFNLPRKAPIASFVLTDTTRPTAMFVANSTEDNEAMQRLLSTDEEAPYDNWLWSGAGEVPEFPKTLR